jgi:hypothetical protein
MYRLLMLGLVAATLAGCAAAPHVQYTKITKPTDVVGDEIDTFSLRASTILIDHTDSKKDAAGKAHVDFSVTSVPKEFPDYKIGVRAADSWGVKTTLTLTKIENTSLLQEAGVDTTDSRSDLITKYGGALVSAIGLIGFTAGTGELDTKALPKHVNPQALLISGNINRDAKSGVDAADGVKIDFGPIGPDAVDASTFVFPATRSGIMYPACRTATVKFTSGGDRFEKTVAISDPRYFAFVAFPVSGKVTFHSECGVSVSSNKDPNADSGVAIVQALLAQGKAVKDALDSSKSK